MSASSAHRIQVLVFTDWFLPGYKAGGPIRSLANLVEAIDVDFFIVTRNTDHHDTIPYKNIEANKWLKRSDRISVFYFTEEKISAKAIRAILTERSFDTIYLNSLFSPKFTLLPLREIRKLKLSEKVLLAPRGMLKPGALSVKAGKKRIFLAISKRINFFSEIAWHATSLEEVSEIKSHYGPKSKVFFAPNLPTKSPSSILNITKSKGDLKLICIARISPEKGILEAISYVKSASIQGSVSIDFYGTQQNEEYLQQCKALAASIEGCSIAFPGPISSEEIPNLISRYHFFYMATWGENYGHAIVESFLAGRPVIISDKTPWQDLLKHEAGWNTPLVATNFGAVLQKCLNMEDSEYQGFSRGAWKLGQRIANNPEILEASKSLFLR